MSRPSGICWHSQVGNGQVGITGYDELVELNRLRSGIFGNLCFADRDNVRDSSTDIDVVIFTSIANLATTISHHMCDLEE
jgi:hypothetical protein